jgi:hypothetical protein
MVLIAHIVLKTDDSTMKYHPNMIFRRVVQPTLSCQHASERLMEQTLHIRDVYSFDAFRRIDDDD